MALSRGTYAIMVLTEVIAVCKTSKSPSWNHKDGWTDTVEWFEDTYQIGYYRLPIEERVTSEDHTPELNFNPDFDSCLDHIEELRDEGYCDISLSEVSEGEYVSEIRIEDYIDGFGEVV
jgi:hypothetical protein